MERLFVTLMSAAGSWVPTWPIVRCTSEVMVGSHAGVIVITSLIMHVNYICRWTKDLTCKLSIVWFKVVVFSVTGVLVVQSAQALMLGMYPRSNSSTTQTVELFTMEAANDYMTVNPKCVDNLHVHTLFATVQVVYHFLAVFVQGLPTTPQRLSAVQPGPVTITTSQHPCWLKSRLPRGLRLTRMTLITSVTVLTLTIAMGCSGLAGSLIPCSAVSGLSCPGRPTTHLSSLQ